MRLEMELREMEIVFEWGSMEHGESERRTCLTASEKWRILKLERTAEEGPVKTEDLQELFETLQSPN